MNKQEADILLELFHNGIYNQRLLSEVTGHSLGSVNQTLKTLREEGYIDNEFGITTFGTSYIGEHAPRNAIILAAGFGMRMIPINMETPKALLEIHGETLIERIICQLHENGIEDITVVVGFLKERFEYLIDSMNVKLVVNSEYVSRNNLHTLALVADRIKNTYIIPCDLWCKDNPFRKTEMYSWYMVGELVDDDSTVRVNRKMELVSIDKNRGGNAMLGIAYISGEDSLKVQNLLQEFDCNQLYQNAFWEEILFGKQGVNSNISIKARIEPMNSVVEINTYEQLRELDEESDHLKSEAIETIVYAMNINASLIEDITVLKKGMTNRSFLFRCKESRYIMRVPGEGTQYLINRRNEATVYSVLQGYNISDEVIFINPDNGYKLVRFWENSRVCDFNEESDLKECMKCLKHFHNLKLHVSHRFDIFERINFYEGLWNGESVFRDYQETKEKVFSLKSFIEKNVEEECLTHIDAVPDNFLFLPDGQVKLIDWEYASMQDPHVDIAMFCIYSGFCKEQIDKLIDIYFDGRCKKNIRIKIYCYISTCGLLWSNWCEYKRSLGVEFGEYSLMQYRYAKEYYGLVKKDIFL